MKTSRFTEEQITYVVRQAEAGIPGADVYRSTGIAEATFSSEPLGNRLSEPSSTNPRQGVQQLHEFCLAMRVGLR